MSDWYSYDWEVQGQTARFTVDLEYAEKFDVMGDHTTLLYVTCTPVTDKTIDFSPRERKRLDALLKSCISLFGSQAVYVGHIDMPSQRRFYFYTADERLLAPLFEWCGKEQVLSLECAKVSEPHRQSYYRMLYPDKAKRQSNDNHAYIASLKKRGDDPSAYRRCNFHLYFPDIQARDAFVLRAKEAGFALGKADYIAEQEKPHYVSMHAVSAMNWKDITHLTTAVIRIAEDYEGSFDHFDSAFVAKRKW